MLWSRAPGMCHDWPLLSEERTAASRSAAPSLDRLDFGPPRRIRSSMARDCKYPNTITKPIVPKVRNPSAISIVSLHWLTGSDTLPMWLQINLPSKKYIIINWIHLHTKNKVCVDQTQLTAFLSMIRAASLCVAPLGHMRSPDCDKHCCKIQHQAQWTKLPRKKCQQKQITQHTQRDLSLNAQGLPIKPCFDGGEILAGP